MDEPTLIEPDTQDWTVVVSEGCAECGYELPAPGEIAPRILDTIAFWPAAMAQSGVRERPAPSTWSPLEYACHVRDVFRLFDTRLGLMLDQDDPLFANWDQDVTAVEDGYATQDPATVAAELRAAGDVIAASFDGVTDEQRSRVGRRSDGAVFTVDSFARYFLHDPVHHVWDVEQGYARLA